MVAQLDMILDCALADSMVAWMVAWMGVVMDGRWVVWMVSYWVEKMASKMADS